MTSNCVYQHEVVMHAQNFVDPNHPEVNMQAAEGLLMQAKHKLRYQSGTNRALFPSYLDAFQWHFSHKIHLIGQHLKLLSDNYHILTVLVIELTVFL